MSKKVTSFVKEVMARLTGNDDQVIAEKNYRLANASVKGQLSSLEGKLVKSEIELESAIEALSATKYPTTLIADSSSYVRNIRSKQESVDTAQEELQSIKESIEYFNGLYLEFNPS